MGKRIELLKKKIVEKLTDKYPFGSRSIGIEEIEGTDILLLKITEEEAKNRQISVVLRKKLESTLDRVEAVFN